MKPSLCGKPNIRGTRAKLKYFHLREHLVSWSRGNLLVTGPFVSHFIMSVIRLIFVSAHSGTGYGINTKPFPGVSRSYFEPDIMFHICVVVCVV